MEQGAIIAFHYDERDFEFTKKFGLPFIGSYQGPEIFGREKKITENCRSAQHRKPTGEVNWWLSVSLQEVWISTLKPAKNDIAFGERKIQYKLRDWLVPTAAIPGPPVPIIYCDDWKRSFQSLILPVEAYGYIDF